MRLSGNLLIVERVQGFSLPRRIEHEMWPPLTVCRRLTNQLLGSDGCHQDQEGEAAAKLLLRVPMPEVHRRGCGEVDALHQVVPRGSRPCITVLLNERVLLVCRCQNAKCSGRPVAVGVGDRVQDLNPMPCPECGQRPSNKVHESTEPMASTLDTSTSCATRF